MTWSSRTSQRADGVPSLAVVVVLGFAAFRATRLLTRDTITGVFRDRLFHFAWDVEHPTPDPTSRKALPTARAAWRTYLYEGLTCPWCLGVWVSGAVYAGWRWGGTWGRGIITVTAIAGVQAVIAANGDRDEE